MWQLLDAEAWVEREAPSAIPADVWEGLSVLRYHRRNAAQSWADMAARHEAATQERRR